ncbi:MAG TPA: hypothetical protein PKY96_05395 [Flavobacteriales bacterium]|nr:hypothetical protein [Flavobacteriales bacterium]
MRNVILLPLAALVLGQTAAAQSRQSTCIWSEDFEQGIPVGWTTNQVERQTSAGVGLGEFVPAFSAGIASDANTGGYFPVPDMPVGNRFAMANDDALPCNCDLDSAVLATPSIDLSGAFDIALDLRVYHTRSLGGGEARIDFSANGGEWLLFEMIPSGEGWQQLTFDLSSLGGISDLRLRFQWSDSANWAGGFAIDDICIRDQLEHDLAVTGARMGDANASPFTPGSNGLGYRLLPLEQSRAMAVSVDLHNVGTARLYAVAVNVIATQNGVDHGPYSASLDSINSGERASVVVQTNWAPDALGEVTYTATASSSTGEDDANDNIGVAVMTMTGPGWDDGYGAMTLDAGASQGAVRSESNFIAAVRFQLVNDASTARGISAVLDPSSQVGQEIRGILMDANFSFIDTTLRHAITEDDLIAAAQGLPVYLPFPNPPSLEATTCFAGLQRLIGTGQVGVLTSGNGPIGAAAFMEGLTFDINWMTAMPMVRLHLNDYGVGLVDPMAAQTGTRILPMPVSASGQIVHTFSGTDLATLIVRDASGRQTIQKVLGRLPKGEQSLIFDASELSNGAYILQILEGTEGTSLRFVVAR